MCVCLHAQCVAKLDGRGYLLFYSTVLYFLKMFHSIYFQYSFKAFAFYIFVFVAQS